MASTNGKDFINTFIKGMDLDTNVTLVPNEAYTYGENVRVIVDNSSNTGALHAIEGLTKLNSNIIEYKYYEYDINNNEVLEKYADFDPSKIEVIGVGVIRDYVCLFTRDLVNEKYNYIFRLKIINSIPELTLIASGKFNIGGIDKNQISITTKWEDFDNIKVYWSDGVNSLRSINIAENSDLDNYNKSPNFFDNTLTINVSKPKFVTFIPGNLKAGMIQYAYQMFNKNGSETVISPLSDLIHLTKSNSFDKVYQGSEKGVNTSKSCKIKFEVTDDRFSRCKIYRIHYTDATTQPEIYIASEFTISTTTEDGVRYQYYSDNGTELDKITYEEFVSSNPYYFIPKVIESKDNRLFAANIIEDTWVLPDHTKDNWYDTRAFRFARNTIDGTHAKITSLNNDTKIITYEHLNDLSNDEWKQFVPFDHDCINPLNSDFSSDLKRDSSSYEWYWDNTFLAYKGGIGRNVSYKIVHTKFGEDYYEEFDGTRTQFMSKKTDYNGHAKDVTLINQGLYEDTGLPIYYNISSVSDINYETPHFYSNEGVYFGTLGALNYSNPYLDGKYRSYQRDDIYRFGVVFYNELGQTSPVNWIGDIRMPSMMESQHRLFDQWERIKVDRTSNKSNIYQVVTYPMGLEFKFKNLPEEIKQLEIVRCERTRDDRRIIAQGLISRTGTRSSDRATRPLLTMNYNNGFSTWLYTDRQNGSPQDAAVNAGRSINFTDIMNNDKTIFTFISPEVSYFKDLSEDITNRVNTINVLYGMSSPTYLNNPYQNPNNVRDAAVRDINTLVHVYNSQTWFNGEYNPTVQLSGDDVRTFMDGSINKYENQGITLDTVGYVGGIGADSQYTEILSKYVAKLYNPFTKYTGSTSNPDLANKYLSFNIDTIKYATGLKYNQYEEITSGLHTIGISGNSYQNWTVDKTIIPEIGEYKTKFKHGSFSPTMVFKSDGLNESVLPYITYIGTADGFNVYSNYFGRYNFNVPPQTNSNAVYGLHSQSDKANCYTINATFLTNLCQNSSMYGGEDYNSRSNSVYISTQSFTNIDSNSNSTQLVFGGDTYIGISEQIQQHWYYLASDPTPANNESWNKRGEKAQIVLYYPCESTINLSMTHGSSFHTYANISETNNKYLTNKDGNFPNNIELEPYASPDNFTQEKPLYTYNSVYSTNPTAVLFLPRGVYTENNKNFDYRVLYSEMKTNDEINDNWLKFKPANYLDVDTRFGSINNMRLFNNNLYYWQDDSFGVLSVNTRSLIQDNNIGQLVLGKGDVLERYDHISTSNGSKKDVINNICITPSTMFWYDHDRGEMLAFSNQLDPISKTKNIQSFFNINKENINDEIITLYNKKYNEVNFMFNMNDDSYKHLIYNEQVNGFSSFYTFDPDWFIDLKDNYYTLKNNDIHQLNSDNYNRFYTSTINDTKIQTVINETPTQTKVFDNVEISGNIELNEFFLYNTNTKTQSSENITEDDVKLKEDNYRFYVPRSTDIITTDSELFPNYKDRMRGKYMFANFNFRPLNNDLEIPYIKTSYRISNI